MVLETVKGNIYQLCIEPKIISIEEKKLYKHSFIVNKIQIELLTNKLITAKDGDFVIVTGIYTNDIFKAYSLKKII
jgi:hypothetical protein